MAFVFNKEHYLIGAGKTMHFFEVARTERDQDVFIEWILSLYDSDLLEERVISRKFYEMLLPTLNPDEKIISARTKREFNLGKAGRIDIICVVETERKTYLVAIEDKVNASLSNDLLAYENYIRGNKTAIIKKFHMVSKEIKEIFIVFKTGLRLSDLERRKIKESSFVLVDREKIIKHLKESSNYLIKEFLYSISYSDSSSLTKFSRYKDLLCSRLNEMLKTSIDYNNGKYKIELDDENKFWIEINDFSLTSPEVTIRLYGDKIKKTQDCYFELIKHSDHKLVGRKTIKLCKSTLGELSKVLKEAIDAAETLIGYKQKAA